VTAIGRTYLSANPAAIQEKGICLGLENVSIEIMSRSDVAPDSASNGQEHDRHDLPPGLVCPSCGSKLIRRSMRRTLKDRFMSMVGKWPYRCQMCNMRFFGPQDPLSLAKENAPSPEEEEMLANEAGEEQEPKN